MFETLPKTDGVCNKGRGVAVHEMFLIQHRRGKKRKEKEIQLYRIWKFESDNKSLSY